ncbi:MAG: acetaldehyde dehydrogenase (acetylating) [Gammaproteobacteria bacterium]|nr:acetaldehyde dehydrogenase (acetylating) [Gammaproteobacteria bacterium]
MNKLKVAILGSGNIGTDLLIKSLRSPHLDCQVLIGRSHSSNGLQKAASLGVATSTESIDYIIKNPQCCDIVFDATSAKDHFIHAPILKDLGKFVIDLTPACVGEICVPAVNLEECLTKPNVNMITCGGQASIPIAYAIGQVNQEVEYIEVVSSIASRGAGPATRLNLDEYINTTEFGLKRFSGALKTKTILNLNPALPCINMQTTIFAKVKHPNLPELQKKVAEMVERIKRYVPGYEIILNPMLENGRIVVMLRVKGLGDYLPEYAGNLDIINCAAIAVAESYAIKRANISA